MRCARPASPGASGVCRAQRFRAVPLRRSVGCCPSTRRGGVRGRAAILWRRRRLGVGEAASRPPPRAERGRAAAMSSFSESALEKKLSELSNSQQSVQTLSLWLIHHRKHAGPIVSVWHRELRKAKSSWKLTFLYLANDVIQNSKRKGPEFTREFESVLVDAFSHVAREADEGCKKPLERLLNIWQERSVYGSEFIQQLKLSMEDSNSPQTKGNCLYVSSVAEEKKSLKRTFQQIQEEEDDDYPGSYSPQDPSAGPLLTEDLIKALQDLENAASGDATVRQKIASLPQEVQDVSLLEKITDKEAAERLSKTVDEACLLLAEYNGRLAAELEDRRQLARMLIEYTQNQKDVLMEKEKKLE
ncbi:RPR1B protein, partial [Syrrhaptes paradoxus]|nr:RPR1B protein [Syrrhaptes paradoxus]